MNINDSYKPKLGDIFLCDSDRLAAKMVKFLMQSPTIYHQIYRWIFKKLEPVRYYHAGMIFDEFNIIEQQGKVQLKPIDKILSRKIIIYRKKDLNLLDKYDIYKRAERDLGKHYGVLLVLAKAFAWLTGMFFVVNWLGRLDKTHQICINRVCKWYDGVCDFGSKGYFLDNTKTVDEYCRNNSEDWEIVYKNKGE